jgi:hypothetical protein
MRSNSACSSVLTPCDSGPAPLTGEYSLLSATLDGPTPSSSGVSENPLSDSVNGLNDLLSITVLGLRCGVALLVLARFGAGLLPHLLTSPEAVLALRERRWQPLSRVAVGSPSHVEDCVSILSN